FCAFLNLLLCWFRPLRSANAPTLLPKTKVEQALKPRSPLDCLYCRRLMTKIPQAEEARALPPQWPNQKNKRGRPKTISSQGYACPNPQYLYFGITDQHHHALVGDGCHGKTERIQTFRCQACKKTFTSRRHTPLYRIKTPATAVAQVLTALAYGLD